MCVIINRDPNVEIEYGMIESACKVNPHGFGLMFAEDGKLNIIKEFKDEGNDPERIARLLEDHKDYTISLHLRYQTVGERSLLNCHPFVTCIKGEDDFDLAFMHNGTLSDFKRSDTKMADSYHFNEEIVRPLALRVAAFDTPETVLWDPFLQEVLKKYSGVGSVFSLMDGEGNVLVINEDRGKKFEGWWASNDYSFNRYHREPVKRDDKSGWYYNGKYYNRDYTYPPKNDPLPSKEETKLLPVNIVKQVPEVEPPTPRQSFVEVAQISDLTEVARLTEEDIEELIEIYPEYAKLLIQDLVLALYEKESAAVTTPEKKAVNA